MTERQAAEETERLADGFVFGLACKIRVHFGGRGGKRPDQIAGGAVVLRVES